MLWGSSSHTERPHIGALVCGPSLQVQAADIMSWKEVIAATFGPNDWPTVTTKWLMLTTGGLGWRLCSVMSNSCDPTDCSLPGPLSMRFSRQEFWSGLPFPAPGESSWPRDQTHISWQSDSLPPQNRGQRPDHHERWVKKSFSSYSHISVLIMENAFIQ